MDQINENVKKYDENQDFIHHDDDENDKIESDFSITHNIYCHFLKPPLLFNKNAYQLFQCFSKQLKQSDYFKGELLKVSFKRINAVDLVDFDSNMKEETPILSKDLKSSLDDLQNANIKHEIYEKDITLYKYTMNFLQENLMKPNEFLYGLGGYKPIKMKLKQKSQKKKIINNLDISNGVAIWFRAQTTPIFQAEYEKQKNLNNLKYVVFFKFILEKTFQITILEWEKKFLQNKKYENFELDIDNFRFGLIEFPTKQQEKIEVSQNTSIITNEENKFSDNEALYNKKSRKSKENIEKQPKNDDSQEKNTFVQKINNSRNFHYLFDLSNLSNYDSNLRQKSLGFKISSSDSNKQLSLYFMLKITEKTTDKDKIHKIFFKVSFKFSRVFVEKSISSDNLQFFFELDDEFPKCYFQQIDDDDFESHLFSKTFIRCNNFLINSTVIDAIILTHMKNSGGFQIEFSKAHTKNSNFKRFCEFLKLNGLVERYYNEDLSRVLEFHRLKTENSLTMHQLLNVKYLKFHIKWYFLVLNSMNKLQLFRCNLHDFERLKDFKPEHLLNSLKNLVYSKKCKKLMNFDDFYNYVVHHKLNKHREIIKNTMMLIKKILVSPTNIRFCHEEELLTIRELENSKHNYNQFLLVKFVDEDMTPFYNEQLINWAIFQSFLEKPIKILDKTYELVGFNTKLLNKQAFLAVSKDLKISAEKIRENLLGKLSIVNDKLINQPTIPLHFINLPYYCYRMSNCLGLGLKLGEIIDESLDKSQMTINLELTKNEEELEGMISQDLLQEISIKLNYNHISALEVNFFGYHMILVLKEDLCPRTIRVHKSIYERIFYEIFSTEELLDKSMKHSLNLTENEENNTFFDPMQTQTFDMKDIIVLNLTRPQHSFLNNHLIAILMSLEDEKKIEWKPFDFSNYLIFYQKELLQTIREFSKKHLFLTIISKTLNKNPLKLIIKPKEYEIYEKFNIYTFFQKMQENNIEFEGDIFHKMLTDSYYSALLKEFRSKACYQPFDHMYSLMYTKDPFGLLKGNQAFLQIEKEKNEVLKGKFLILREFSIDPVDIHILEGIASPSHRYNVFYNILIVSVEMYIEIEKTLKSPYKYSNNLIVIKSKEMFFTENLLKTDDSKGIQDKMRAIYDLAIERINNHDSNDFIRISNICNFFIYQISNKDLKRYKIEHSKLLAENRAYLFKSLSKEGYNQARGDVLTMYINSIFSCYLGRIDQKHMVFSRDFPDFLKDYIRINENRSYKFNVSLAVEGLLYREILKEIALCNKNSDFDDSSDNFCYEFSQTHYDKELASKLTEEITDKILQVKKHLILYFIIKKKIFFLSNNKKICFFYQFYLDFSHLL